MKMQTLAAALAVAIGSAVLTARADDFTIEDGVLVSYNGVGGDVVIPNSVTNIGEAAFSDCSGLTSVTIPNGVTSIGEYAFSNTGLTSVTIPDSVTSIGGGAFTWCLDLTSVTIGSGVASIGDEAFSYCRLTSVTIPDSVRSIGECAFFECSSLTNVTIPASVTSIGDGVFSYCSGLTSVTIPDSVRSIGECAFYATGLTSVTIPEGMTDIGDSAFSDCESLVSVTIPGSVTSIGANAFSGCSNIVQFCISDLAAWCNVVLGDGSASYENFFANPLRAGASSSVDLYLNGERVLDLTIPEGVTNIATGAFMYGNFDSIHFPSTLMEIGAYAFYECSHVREINLNDNLVRIANYSFAGCANALAVHIPSSLRDVGSFAFHRCESLKRFTSWILNHGSASYSEIRGLIRWNWNRPFRSI